ncbi:MAG: DUF3596 domain-containing protein [Cyanobacteria bacterium P01_G01_bin.38]
MTSAPKKHKASKGTVRIKSSNDRLQLVFTYIGKRHYLSTGLPDTTINRRAAEAKAKLIESDIAFDRFDPTFARYKPEYDANTQSAELNLADLWPKFIEFKRPQCSPNTMSYTYGPYTNHIARFPTHDLSRASEMRDYILAHLSLDTSKRLITRISACCDWAIDSGFIEHNPFLGMAAKIKVPKSVSTDGLNDINPFSASERDAIIQAIETDQFSPRSSAFKHSYYTALIKFLFSTGCRPSEASALTWKYISKKCKEITFSQALIRTETGKRIRDGLKTQEQRIFPCNKPLRRLLCSIKPDKVTSETFVFPSPEGKAIDLNNFRNRTWAKVLKGLNLEYRKLYQTRHTFITLALEAGMDAKDVARLVGNSPEVIYKYYAAKKRKLDVPEF